MNRLTWKDKIEDFKQRLSELKSIAGLGGRELNGGGVIAVVISVDIGCPAINDDDWLRDP